MRAIVKTQKQRVTSIAKRATAIEKTIEKIDCKFVKEIKKEPIQKLFIERYIEERQ